MRNRILAEGFRGVALRYVLACGHDHSISAAEGFLAAAIGLLNRSCLYVESKNACNRSLEVLGYFHVRRSDKGGTVELCSEHCILEKLSQMIWNVLAHPRKEDTGTRDLVKASGSENVNCIA